MITLKGLDVQINYFKGGYRPIDVSILLIDISNIHMLTEIIKKKLQLTKNLNIARKI